MSIESEPSKNKLEISYHPKNKIEISYHPKNMISILERNGYVTDHSLMQELECSFDEAGWIILDLTLLGVVSSTDDDWIVNEERKVVERTYRLTEAGRQNKDAFKQRRFELIAAPSLAKMSMETANDVLDATSAMGLNLADLAEMIRTNDPKLSELFRQRRIAVLKEFSPEELRQLDEDTKLL